MSAALARVAAADAARYPGFRLGGSLGPSALTPGPLTTRAFGGNSPPARGSGPAVGGGAARAPGGGAGVGLLTNSLGRRGGQGCGGRLDLPHATRASRIKALGLKREEA